MSSFGAEVLTGYAQELAQLRSGIQESVDNFITDICNDEFLRVYSKLHEREVSMVPIDWRSENLSVLPLTLYEMQSFAIDSFRRAKLGVLADAKTVNFLERPSAESCGIVRGWRYPTARADVFVFEQNSLHRNGPWESGLGLRLTNFVPDFAYKDRKALQGTPQKAVLTKRWLRAVPARAGIWLSSYARAQGYGTAE